ncbi:putative non-specific serine/threonine protein kinase [Rosa chinensis]|uniref:Putative non-specific serine/threonine protein kinase n=1 Tax=Rosa chinensis TaxID=74649 RepID=A0A2P6SAD5_ROSCH|nr:putative non-specific serine/threonine protein kinase [Rosa chinensis]
MIFKLGREISTQSFSPKEVGGTSQVAKAPLSSSRGSQVPYTTSYGDSETLLREFCLNFEAEEQSLNITCIHSQQGWIRVYQRDRNHVHANQSLPLGSRRRWGQASYLGSSDSRYYVENNTALEMIYRINVGGSPVSPNEDTGTYRTWNPTDKFYLNDQSKTLSSVSRSNITHLNFARIPNYTAPEEVNQTGRTMGGNNTINNSYNLTWGFRIDPNFSYLVRLHFCEIESNVTKAGDRMFQIFIANLIAEPYADIIKKKITNYI